MSTIKLNLSEALIKVAKDMAIKNEKDHALVNKIQKNDTTIIKYCMDFSLLHQFEKLNKKENYADRLEMCFYKSFEKISSHPDHSNLSINNIVNKLNDTSVYSVNIIKYNLNVGNTITVNECKALKVLFQANSYDEAVELALFYYIAFCNNPPADDPSKSVFHLLGNKRNETMKDTITAILQSHLNKGKSINAMIDAFGGALGVSTYAFDASSLGFKGVQYINDADYGKYAVYTAIKEKPLLLICFCLCIVPSRKNYNAIKTIYKTQPNNLSLIEIAAYHIFLTNFSNRGKIGGYIEISKVTWLERIAAIGVHSRILNKRRTVFRNKSYSDFLSALKPRRKFCSEDTLSVADPPYSNTADYYGLSINNSIIRWSKLAFSDRDQEKLIENLLISKTYFIWHGRVTVSKRKTRAEEKALRDRIWEWFCQPHKRKLYYITVPIKKDSQIEIIITDIEPDSALLNPVNNKHYLNSATKMKWGKLTYSDLQSL